MYDEAVDGIITKMLKKSAVRGLLYVADLTLHSNSLNSKMDHLGRVTRY